ncbi:MAG: hypothetical protein KKF00_08535 [Proteobacteria bacterium]|nr:hypothetical protein [Pseudomonadota bacterium]
MSILKARHGNPMDDPDAPSADCLNGLVYDLVGRPRSIRASIPAKWRISIMQNCEGDTEFAQYAHDKQHCVLAASPDQDWLSAEGKLVGILVH